MVQFVENFHQGQKWFNKMTKIPKSMDNQKSESDNTSLVNNRKVSNTTFDVGDKQ